LAKAKKDVARGFSPIDASIEIADKETKHCRSFKSFAVISLRLARANTGIWRKPDSSCVTVHTGRRFKDVFVTSSVKTLKELATYATFVFTIFGVILSGPFNQFGEQIYLRVGKSNSRSMSSSFARFDERMDKNNSV